MAETNATIGDLVCGGQATPQDGALLMELRHDVLDRQARKQYRTNALGQFFVAFGAFLVVYFSRKQT